VAIVDGLITLADARASLGLTSTNTQYDTDIENYIMAATPVIENIAGDMIVRTKTFYFNGGRPSVLIPQHINSVTSVKEWGMGITDYVVALDAGVVYAGSIWIKRDFLPGNQSVEVVCSVGLPVIPQNVKLATRELVRHWWQIGRQGTRPAIGQAESSQPEVSSGFAVPRRVIELLQATPRMAGFA